MESVETIIQVNKFARRNRHLKVFSRGSLLKAHLAYLFSEVLRPVVSVVKGPFTLLIGRFSSIVKNLTEIASPLAPKKRLLLQSALLAGSWIVVTSLSHTATFTSASMSYATDYIAAYAVPGDILVADEDGYLVKINPQTNESSRIGLTDYAVHTVESGESLSVIAEKYGVKVETIMWENKIGNANSLRIGQSLLVPPVDGISYEVKGGDNLEKIAKKYTVSVEAIIAQNSLADQTVLKGQNLFLPGAKPLFDPVNIASVRNAVAGRDARSLTGASSSSAAPGVGKIFIFPTIGKVTQGFKGGHYALDIADSSKPAIWAAGNGTVVKASSGTWGGGYGNHVIIDHGDGTKSLYAHMNSLNVEVGQWVNQGDVIGIMGNSGRVYGVTGIHLHFEVIVNGVKKNPWNYM